MKSDASWRSRNCSAGSPKVRLTLRPRPAARTLTPLCRPSVAHLYSFRPAGTRQRHKACFGERAIPGHTAISAIV